MGKRRYTEKEQAEFERIKREALAHLDGLQSEPCDRGVFSDYSVWDDTIHDKVLDFHAEKSIYPNILLANTFTFKKIDDYLKLHPENLHWGGEGDQPEFDGLAEFNAKDYTLWFCFDYELLDNVFTLVYDEDPIFDGEETPESVTSKYVKKAA